MSLIEQAAKRLEELRRAGAELPESPAEAGHTARPGDHPPTPEAIVRVLEARGAAESSVLRERTQGPATAVSGVRYTPLSTQHRRVDIDLAGLAKRGFITPNAPQSQLADEFRVVKRPIIRNATGKGGSKVKNRNLVMVTSALPAEGKTFMIVAADTTTQHAVTQALSTVENCEIVLMMLNKARKTDVGSYYGYYADDAAP